MIDMRLISITNKKSKKMYFEKYIIFKYSKTTIYLGITLTKYVARLLWKHHITLLQDIR